MSTLEKNIYKRVSVGSAKQPSKLLLVRLIDL